MLKFLKDKSAYLKSIKWGGFSIVLVFFKQMLLVPVFITTLGKDNYAVWLIITSITLMVRSLNLGQLNFTSNSINLNYHVKKNINEELILGQGANIINLFLQFCLGLILSRPIVLSFFSNIEIKDLDAVNASYCLLFVVFGRTIFQYCSLFLLRLFEPIGKINKTIKYRVLGELMDFLVTVSVVYATKNLLYTCIAIFISNTLYTLFMYKYIRKKVPFYIPVLVGINFLKSFSLIRKSLQLTLSFIVEKIYEVGLNLVIVRFFSLGVLPLFSTTRVLSNSSLSVSNAMAVPLMPNIQKQFSLDNEEAITNTMSKFWGVSTSLIIIVITLGIPFLPYVYALWTAGEIGFNLTLMSFLFMAIAFQNYALMFAEFFKKTNLSKQILSYNILKVTITILALSFFGYIEMIEGMGIALLTGEFFGLLYFFIVVKKVFIEKSSLITFIYSLIPVILFSLSLFYYAMTEEYIIFLSSNVIIVGIVFRNKFIKKTHNDI